MASADLRLDDVRKTYRGDADVAAVNGITLSVAAGEFLTLLGPSGCGKTTLLRIIGGFIEPTSGRVAVGGQDVTALPPEKRPTAMVFQNYALFPHMTVADNVAFGLKVRRRPAEEIARRVRDALSVVSLPDAGRRYPHQLSGGQQQRVALARAVAVEPPVLLMDEPLGALDAKLREEMQGEICAIQRRLGITMVYVTHDQEEAFSMSDRVAVMNGGRVLQLGPPDEIYRRPANVFVANFVGRSNVLAGTVGPDGALVLDGGRRLAAPMPQGLVPGAHAVMIVRPEDVHIATTEDAAPAADNVLEARVDRSRFRGGAHLYYLRAESGPILMAEGKRRLPLKTGERVRVSWSSADAVVLPAAGQDG